MITEIKTAKPAKGVSEIFLPGEIELCRREKWRREGIPLAVSYVDDLRREAEQWQVPFTLC
jgi:LDH2 family malate/lactate/ureidoglycolate dehydrogenase